MKLRAALLLAIPFAAGCNQTYDNPFHILQTTPPPAAADLLVVNAGSSADSPREIFAIDVDTAGGAPVRLTSCAAATVLCDFVEVAPAPDRTRVVARRRIDANGDGQLGSDEPEQVFVMDLQRGIEGQILADQKGVDSLQWTALEVPLFFSAVGLGGLSDIYASAQDGTGALNLSQTATLRERHPRAVGTLTIFEQSTPGTRSQIVGSITPLPVFVISGGDPNAPTTVLPGTDYVLGSDADPSLAPDASAVVFRRLTGTTADGRGTWDIIASGTDGTNARTLVSGGAYRSAPDWGAKGIAFVEIPTGSTNARLVVISPDGTGQRTVLDGAPTSLGAPRWLP